MSPNGALILALAALVALAALATWLLNVPLWSVTGLVAIGAVVVALIYQRMERRGNRQKTET